jgi:hypothetical protein
MAFDVSFSSVPDDLRVGAGRFGSSNDEEFFRVRPVRSKVQVETDEACGGDGA